MSELNSRESELVALGAALGSNCVPCIEYHIPQARKAGLTDLEIHAAIRKADQVRQVPARKVLDTAMKLLAPIAAEAASAAAAGCGCGCGSEGAKAAGAELTDAGRTPDGMAGMMSRMMSSCAPLAAAAGGTQTASGKDRVEAASEAASGRC